MKAKHIIGIAAIGLGAYLLYRFWNAAKTVATAAGNAAAAPIADAYLALTLPGAVNVTGAVILPDGSAVQLNTLSVDSNAQVNIGGKTYQLTSHDANGNYPAILISG